MPDAEVWEEQDAEQSRASDEDIGDIDPVEIQNLRLDPTQKLIHGTRGLNDFNL